MEKNQRETWQQIAIREYLRQQEKGFLSINWVEIVRKIEKVHPKMFIGCSSPNRKIYDYIRRNPGEIESYLAFHKKAGKLTNEDSDDSQNIVIPKSSIASTAHVNDEDNDCEEESEIVASVNFKESKINKDGTQTIDVEIIDEATREKLMDEYFLLTKLGYDPLAWEIVSSSCRKGEWDAQIAGGSIKKLFSYRVNANVKKREGSVCETALLQKFMEHVESNEKQKPKYEQIKVEGENCAIISIADLHLGKLAWYKECGGNYDYKICRDRYFYIINKAITRLKKVENLEKVIFFWSQDFFHYDNLEVTTTAGTKQDTDVRWQKLYELGCKMLVDGIELLLEELKVPIQTFYTRSNHDTQVSFYALQYVYAWFHKNPNVLIDTSPIGRKYIEYGINLMGFGHGDEEKKRIHQLMQVEEKEAWGRTINHEFFLGHFHKQMVNDESGVLARYLASPTETDAWHHKEGFIGALKQAQVFIRNKYEGPTDQMDINILE